MSRVELLCLDLGPCVRCPSTRRRHLPWPRHAQRAVRSTMPPKMAAFFALVSILCHLVVLGLLVQTRVELSTVR